MVKKSTQKADNEDINKNRIAIDPKIFTSQSSVGLAAGDMRVAVLKEVNKFLNENQGNPVKACNMGLKRLASEKLLSDQEVKQITEICKIVYDRQRNKLSINDASRKIDAIYHPLILKPDTSPVALAIASMASTVELAEAKSLGAAAAAGYGGDIGMVGGAIAGASIGILSGAGPGGAIIGAVVGGIAAGVAGACADE